MTVREQIKSQKGFTLVELMTVVAIIGILASVGVPQYRKIQRKAKRTEASLALGVIASSEAAFYAEYVGYGNNLGAIGAELEFAPKNYNVGFLTSGAPQRSTVDGTGAVTAKAPSMMFCELNVGCGTDKKPGSFPGYYSAGINSPIVQSSGSGSNITYASAVTADNKVPVTGFQAILTISGGAVREMNADTKLFGGTSGTSHGTSDFTWTAYPASSDTPRSGIYCGANNADCRYKALAVGNLYGRLGADVRMDIISIDQQRQVLIEQDGT